MNWKRRIRWEVLPGGGLLRRWKLTRAGGVVGYYFLKASALAAAVAACRWEWETLRQRSELLIHDEHGQYQDSRTYGDDPAEIKG